MLTFMSYKSLRPRRFRCTIEYYISHTFLIQAKPLIPHSLRQIQTQPQIRPTLQARSWAKATLKTSYKNTRSWLKRDGLHTKYSLQTLHPSNLYHNILTRTKLTLTGGLSILFRALTPPSICSSSSSSPYLETILCQSFTFYCCIGLMFLCLPFDLS